MNAAQCRMGRAALDWTTAELAAEAGVSIATINRFERGGTVPTANNIAAMRRAMEAAGVEFTNGDAPGVRLRMPRDGSGDGETDATPTGQSGRRGGSCSAGAMAAA